MLSTQSRRCVYFLACAVLVALQASASAQNVFPAEAWQERKPAELGMNADSLDELAKLLGGRGCVIKDGYVVKAWGDQKARGDWFSSAKPVLSTLLFFAIEEGLVKSVDQPITDFGWKLKEKDQGMTFRHLGSMNSGYARPEGPGQAWAYNDYAIQLYQKTLFDKVFKGEPKAVAEAAHRLGALGLQDGLQFRANNRRLSGSVRDFARIAWLWCNHGKWGDKQVLPKRYFDDYVKPQTAKDLALTKKAGTDDYLGIGTFGGDSDHFTRCGPGIYGFNWWFNETGGSQPKTRAWPDAPADTFMSLGRGGNSTAVIPSLNLVLVVAKGDWDDLKAGDATSKINRALALLVKATKK